MKLLSDLVQVCLSLPSALGFLACVLLVLVCWQVCKSLREIVGFAWTLLKWLKARFIRLSRMRVGFACLLAVPLFLGRGWVSDKLQYLEQVWTPAYVTSDTSAHALAIYEEALARGCDTWEAGVVRRRVQEIAAKVGCSPLAIYEVAWSECGLNPFKIRDDGVAAGFIQFTAVGATGITTLPEVKAACKNRDIEKMMDWTERYLVSRANGKPLRDATDVYVCVFAPGFVGAPDEQVLYQGWRNPAYYMNRIFDGYHIDHKGRIMRRDAAMDGKITIGELRLHLEAKKARLIGKQKNI